MANHLYRRFSLAEIRSATGDFSDRNVVGKGGFGKVYEGLIDNGSLRVAIKRLASNSNQGEKEFEAEMEALTKFRHCNIVSLVGYCSEQGELILVLEYMAKGTLADHLYTSNGGGSSLSWDQRLKICIGAGRGLDYLHSGCSTIHRDVKSTNILLDENFRAKVSDFGLAKHLGAGEDLESHLSASIKGSFGYFDPSYFTTGRLTKASDSYSFGVVLLEVLSGRPATGPVEGELCMKFWALEKIRIGRADQIVASNLKGEISDGCLKTFVGAAKRCLDHEPKKRLTMTRVVALLELALEKQETREMTTRKLVQFRPLNSLLRRIVASGSTQNNEFLSVDVPAFPLVEVYDITDGFSYRSLVEGSGFGFHGVLKSGQDAAIIMLDNKLPYHHFQAQVITVSSQKHSNVVRLLGCCSDGLRVMVYEFAPRGSLYDALHGRQRIQGSELEVGPVLSWAQRMKFAVGIAKGLCYIHHKGLVHLNITSSNVLLFDDETAKITNLHPSTECSCKASYRSASLPKKPYRGVKRYPFALEFSNDEYHPPECGWSNQSQKGDVYSFGLVLLELLTGRELFDRPRGAGNKRHLLSWVKRNIGSDKAHEIVDSSLEGDYPLSAVQKMGEVVQLCLQYKADMRPDMHTVLRALQIASMEIIIPGLVLQ